MSGLRKHRRAAFHHAQRLPTVRLLNMSDKYERLRGSGDSQEVLLGRDHERAQLRNPTKERLFIAVEAVLICILLVVIVGQRLQWPDQRFWSRSFDTDFSMLIAHSRFPWAKMSADDLGSVIPFKQQPFINPLRPTSDYSALEIEWKEGQPRYNGEPGPEMDAAWDKLLSSESDSHHLARAYADRTL